jgi:hypothetical protein
LDACARLCLFSWIFGYESAYGLWLEKVLKTTLKAEIYEGAWAPLNSDTPRALDRPKSGRIAVKVINYLRDEMMKVFLVK